jgi:hypothetical protein
MEARTPSVPIAASSGASTENSASSSASRLLELQVLRHRDGELLTLRGRGQVHQLRGVRVGERPQQHAVDDRKDSGVRADPERERENRHRGEDRRAPERPQPVTHVAHEILEARHQLDVAARFAQSQPIAELAPRHRLGRFAGHPLRDEVVDAGFDLERDLLIEGAIGAG